MKDLTKVDGGDFGRFRFGPFSAVCFVNRVSLLPSTWSRICVVNVLSRDPHGQPKAQTLGCAPWLPLGSPGGLGASPVWLSPRRAASSYCPLVVPETPQEAVCV